MNPSRPSPCFAQLSRRAASPLTSAALLNRVSWAVVLFGCLAWTPRANAAVSDENFDSAGLLDVNATSLAVGTWTFTTGPLPGGTASRILTPNASDNYLNLNNDGGGGDRCIFLNENGAGVSDFSFRSTDGTNFALNTIKLGSILGGSENVVVSGWRDGVQVVSNESVDLTVSDSSGNITYTHIDTNLDGSYGTLTFGSAFNNVDEIRLDFGFDSFIEIDDIDISAAVLPSPTITSATYNASSGALVVTGTNFTATGGTNNDVVANTFTLTGEGGSTYTLTDTANVEISSSTSFTLTLSATDRAATNLILNKNGTSSTGATTYNLAGAAGFIAASASDADLTGNGITVSNVAVPAITSATYDASTGSIVVTGTNFLKLNGATNDIDVSKLSFTGEGGSTYTLTTTSVEISSGTSFTVTLNATDRGNVNQILNKNGTSSTGATTYNLSAAENWAAGADSAVVVADLTGNGVTVSNVAVPAITSATYDASTGSLVVTGTGFLKLSGATNDIDGLKFSFRGEGGAGSTFTFTDTSSVEITNDTTFTLTLGTADRNAFNLIAGKNGTSSTSGSSYLLNALEDWAAGADSAVTTADSGNLVTVSNVATPSITSATYDAASGSLVVTGTGFVKLSGATNDIDVSKLSLSGDSTSYTLTTGNVEVSSTTSFSVTLNGTDQSALSSRLNKNGTSSLGAVTYNLAAAEDWAAGADSAVVTADLTANGITVSNVATAPAIANLNGDSVAWAGAGNTVALDASANANLTDADFEALNAGNGNWSGATLLVERSGSAISSDTFDFNTTGALFTVSGGNLQSGGQTFATFTNISGTLTISFTSSGTNATTALVNNVAQRITYRNDTPAGDATLRFTLDDGSANATANVTVTSDTIYVTDSTDTSTIDISNGVSFSEAIAIAANDATGTQTIVFASTLASTALTISPVTIAENLTFDMDAASGMSLTTGTLTIGANTLTVTNGSGDTATVSSTISGTGELLKTGAGTLTLNNTSNSGTAWSSRITGGTLSTSAVTHIGSGSVTVNGGTFADTSATADNFSNSFVVGSSGATFSKSSNILTLSGSLSGSGSINNASSGTLNHTGTGTLTLDGASVTRASSAGAITIYANIVIGSGGATFDTTGGDINIYGNLSGSGTTTKQGSSNYLWLHGANSSYSGAFAVTSGWLIANSTTALGSGQITLSAGTTIGFNSGVATFTNNIVLAGDATLQSANTTGTTTTLNGIISQSGGTRNLTIGTATGSNNTMILGGTNTYTGTTTITGSNTLRITDSTNISGAAITLSGAIFQINGSGVTLANAISLSSSSTISNANSVTLSGVLSGSSVLTKSGAGTLTLSNTNTHSGGITVSAGNLSLTGSKASGTITVASGGTLSGTGTQSGPVTVQSGGTLAPGVSGPGIFNLGNGLTIQSGGTLAVDVAGSNAGSGYDILMVTGTVDVSSATLAVTHSYTPGSNDAYLIIDNDSSDAITGTFSGLAQGATLTASGNGTSLVASYIASTGNDFTLTSPDTTPPSVTSVSVPTSTTYRIGQNLDFTVNFSENTTVNTGGGTPRIALSLDTGGTVYANYLSGTGTSALVFRFTVSSGQADTNGITVSALSANGGTLRDAANNDATLTLNSVGSTTSVLIDGIRPTASIVVADTSLIAGETSSVTITFSEAITGFTTGDLTTENGSVSSLSSGDGGVTWTATLTPSTSTEDSSNIITLDNTGLTDVAGNTGSGTTDSNNYVVDTSAPSAPSSFTATPSSSTIALSWTNPVNGDFDSVTIRRSSSAFPNTVIDGTAVVTNSTSTSFNDAGLVDGTYYYSIFAKDVAGNYSARATASATVDSTPPTAPSAPDLATVNDSGASSTDNITNVTTPTFTGTAEANSTVELFRAGTTSLGNTTANGSGAWSLTLGSALPEGTHSITAKSTDSATNTSVASSALSVTIDTTAPAVPALTAITSDTGSSATDQITTDTTLVLSGTGPANETVTVFRNSTQIGTATIAAGGTWSYDYTGTTLAAGTHTFTATSTDTAGNASVGSAAFLVTIDTTTPAAPVISAISTDTGSSSTDGITSDNTLVFTGTAEANATVTVSRNGVGSVGTATANGSGAWSFNYTGTALANGTYLFTAFSTDTAGNNSTVSSDFPVTIDAAAPAITTQPATTTYVTGDTLSLSVAATDSTTLTYQWSQGGVPLTNGSGRSGVTTATLTITNLTASGSFGGNYTVTLTDAAGNVTTSNAAVITVNKADQTLTFPAIADQLATAAPFAISATASTALPVTFSVVSGPATISGSTVTLTGAGSVTIRATQAGNADYNPATLDRTFAVTKAPATVTLGSLAQTYTGAARTATATTTPAGLTVTFTYDGSATAPTNAGSYAVVGTINDTRYAGTASGTLVVAKANQTVTFTTVSAATVNTPVTLSGTASSGLGLTFSLVSGNATVSGSTFTPLNANPIVLRATQAGNGNYNAATADQTVNNITKLSQTITFAALTDKSRTAAPFTISATASSNLAVTFTVQSGPATISGNTVTLTGIPGLVTIAANQTGDAVYAAAPTVTRTFTVTADYPATTPDGFAASVTGGAGTGSQAFTVTTATEFRTQAEATGPAVITVVGTLNLGSTPVAVKSNKTLQGADGSATLIGKLELGSGVNNVILRGLNLTNPGTTIVNGAYTDGGDAVALTGANNVFITHCSFFDAADHALKITSGATNVTVSWSEFYYTGAQTAHRYSVQIGNASGETSALRVSLHHNRWHTNVDQRLPLATFGQVHLYNNVFAVTGNTEGTVASDQSELLSERNIYTGVANPLTRRNVNSASAIGRILALQNVYTSTTGTAPYASADAVFTPGYSYEMLPTSDVVTVVTAAAGNDNGAADTSPAVDAATISASATSVSAGNSFTLTATAPGLTPTSYEWRRNNIAIPGATGSTYTVSNAQAPDVGTYTVAIGLASGDSVVSTPVNITVTARRIGSLGNGGGAPSLWFVAVLALLGATRLRRRGE